MSYVVSLLVGLASHQYYGLLRLLIRHPPGFHLFGLYHSLRWLCASDRMRPLLFYRLLSQHPALPTPESSSRLHFRVFTASIAFAMRDRLGSLLFPMTGLTCRCCKFHFMLRAAVLRSFLRRIQRFDTSGRPEASVACYLTA